MKDYSTKEMDLLVDATIIAQFNGNSFDARLDNEHVLRVVKSGRLSKHKIKITLGDRVSLEISQYNVNLGRIVRRL
jgi:translation initiation factor IF-1